MLAARRGAMSAFVAVASAWLALVLWVNGVRAQPAGTYEQSRLDALLLREHLGVEPAPEGKTIAYIRYERSEVFEGDDLLVPVVLPRFSPTWPNHFHWLTEEVTIARELLLRSGQPFEGARAEESMRNLRELGIFSLVRIVAVKTDDPSQVGVVVYTRDLWSLRLEQSFAGVGSTFSLGVSLVERNFLGRNKQLETRFFLDPLTYSAGQTYLDPRMFGGKLRLYEAFDVIVNRQSGKTEGSVGTLLWGMPFHDLAQERSFDLLAHYADYVYRDAPNGVVTGFDAANGPRHGKSCQPGAPGCIPRVFHDQRVRFEGAFNERIGERYKQTFTVGAGFADRSVAPNAETMLPASFQQVFLHEVLPRVRREAYPFVRYRLSLPRFATFTNLATFGQSETVQTGPRLDARFALPLTEFGSSSDGFVTHGLAGYVWGGHDALVDVVVEAAGRVENQYVIDEEAVFRVRAATPSTDWLQGRFVMRVIWDGRRHDSQNTLVALGGNSGLRGYRSQYFFSFGGSYVLGNLEYRSRPLKLQSVHLGAVAFYDAGTTYTQLSAARLHHAAGAGLRVLFPQFNRYAFRLDAGVPLDSHGFAVTFSYGSDQAIALTPGEDALASSGVELN